MAAAESSDQLTVSYACYLAAPVLLGIDGVELAGSALWRAVEDLSTDLKMALLLRDVVGLSYTEIADSLEITLATVKWRIYKAREEVQLALGREGISFGSERSAASAESS